MHTKQLPTNLGCHCGVRQLSKIDIYITPNQLTPCPVFALEDPEWSASWCGSSSRPLIRHDFVGFFHFLVHHSSEGSCHQTNQKLVPILRVGNESRVTLLLLNPGTLNNPIKLTKRIEIHHSQHAHHYLLNKFK